MSAALPGAPHLAWRGPQLTLEGHNLAALAHTHGTPLYVYSRAAMLAALAPYQRALAGRKHLVCYAMKANASLAVLQTFAQAGCGFDIVSGGELVRALKAGARGEQIVFSGVGKTRADMAQGLAAGVKCFNVESEAELLVLAQVAQAAGQVARVSLRVNPDVDAGTHPYISTGLKSNKFGVPHGQALALYQRAAALPGIEVTGIDCHIGSQITDVAPYLDALSRLLDLVDVLSAVGITLDHIDLGGGLGITYTHEAPPAADVLVAAALQLLDARGHGGCELLLEPGRSLVGNAGVLLTEVLYLKPGDGSPEARNFCIVDAAMNDLLRPALYQATMGITPCQRRTDVAEQVWEVVGPVCESGDWLGHDRRLALAQGDHLAVLSAGAYAMAMASNYNTRTRAAELLLCGEQVHLIRSRETVQQLLANEQLI